MDQPMMISFSVPAEYEQAVVAGKVQAAASLPTGDGVEADLVKTVRDRLQTQAKAMIDGFDSPAEGLVPALTQAGLILTTKPNEDGEGTSVYAEGAAYVVYLRPTTGGDNTASGLGALGDEADQGGIDHLGGQYL